MCQSLFFLRHDSFIFEKFGSRFLRTYKKWWNRLQQTCWKTLLTLISCSLTFFVFDNARKNWRGFFIPWKECLFSKTFVFNNILRPKKWSYYYHSNCQNIFLALINRFMRFATLDTLRKQKANTFVHLKIAFLFKKMCFQQRFRY